MDKDLQLVLAASEIGPRLYSASSTVPLRLNRRVFFFLSTAGSTAQELLRLIGVLGAQQLNR
jgi:hypothetical protein